MLTQIVILVVAALMCLVIGWFIYSFINPSLVVVWSEVALLVGVLIGKVLW